MELYVIWIYSPVWSYSHLSGYEGGRQELAATLGKEVEMATSHSPASFWCWVYQMVASGVFYHFKEAFVKCRLPRLPYLFQNWRKSMF